MPVTWTTDSLGRLSISWKSSGEELDSLAVIWILPVMSFRIRNRTFFRSRVSWTQPFRRISFSELNASLIIVRSISCEEVLEFLRFCGLVFYRGSYFGLDGEKE